MRHGTSPGGSLSPVAGARGARRRPDCRRRSLFASDSSLSPRSGHRLLIGRNGPTRALGTPAQGDAAIRRPARAATGTVAQHGSAAGRARGIRNARAAQASAAAGPARCGMRGARLRLAGLTDSERRCSGRTRGERQFRGDALEHDQGPPGSASQGPAARASAPSPKHSGHPPDRGVAASALPPWCDR